MHVLEVGSPALQLVLLPPAAYLAATVNQTGVGMEMLEANSDRCSKNAPAPEQVGAVLSQGAGKRPSSRPGLRGFLGVHS